MQRLPQPLPRPHEVNASIEQDQTKMLALMTQSGGWLGLHVGFTRGNHGLCYLKDIVRPDKDVVPCRPGDRILSINGQPFSSCAEMSKLLEGPVGSKYRFAFARGQKTRFAWTFSKLPLIGPLTPIKEDSKKQLSSPTITAQDIDDDDSDGNDDSDGDISSSWITDFLIDDDDNDATSNGNGTS